MNGLAPAIKYTVTDLKPQPAEELSTIVWSLSGTLYMKTLMKLSQALAHFKTLMRKKLLMIG